MDCEQDRDQGPGAGSGARGQGSGISTTVGQASCLKALPLRASRVSVADSVRRALGALVVKRPFPALAPSPETLAPARRRRAFTLTELLVVIAIMAVLASLASVAVIRGLDTAKQTRMKVEVDALDAAFKAYKEKYGSYPPCDLRWSNNSAAIKQHIARAFPRYKLANLANELAKAVDTTSFRPDEAMVFWLSGFGPDVTAPFVTPDGLQIYTDSMGNAQIGMKVTRTSFFDFDKSRLIQFPTPGAAAVTITLHSYFPQGVKLDGRQGPYVYFSAHSISGPGGTTVTFYGLPPKAVGMGQPATPNAFNFTNTGFYTPSDITTGVIFADAGAAVPYWNDLNANGHSLTSTGGSSTLDPGEDWINPDSFQIIAPGGDGRYGVDPAAPTTASPPGLGLSFVGARMYPAGVGEKAQPSTPSYLSQDEDNVTNFCARARLGDAKP